MYFKIMVLCFVFLQPLFLLAYPANIDIRFSLGPAWHNFHSYETFNLTDFAQSIFVPSDETIRTDFDVMPYFQGDIEGYLGKYFTFHIYGAGGKLKRGHSLINNSIFLINNFLLPINNDGSYDSHIITSDTNIGIKINTFCKSLINPVLGYVYNTESLKIADYGIAINYKMANIWQGPYIGLKYTQNLLSHWNFLFTYKFVIGKLRSKMRTFTAPNLTLIPPDTSYSLRHGNMFGDILRAEIQYLYKDYSIGSAITYSAYKNHRNSSVQFTSQSRSLIQNAVLKRIMWQQIIWSIVFGCMY